PQQIGGARVNGGLVGRDRAHVRARQHDARDQRQQPAQHRQHDRLIEHKIGIGAIGAAHGMRDQCDGADAQHLHQRVDEKTRIAGCRHARHGGIAETRDKIEVDQLTDHDRDHANHDRRRHGQYVAHDGASREVFHYNSNLKSILVSIPARG
ncbi:hypothetical protein chiPu_0033777, partial [Chiloscyllium punctatum]|nr:hypothetical protein [Chiloscyllium punctatum]